MQAYPSMKLKVFVDGISNLFCKDETKELPDIAGVMKCERLGSCGPAAFVAQWDVIGEQRVVSLHEEFLKKIVVKDALK